MSMWGKAAKFSFKAGRGVSAATERSAASWIANRGRKAASRGLIGPWDPPPPAGFGGYVDYAGVATPSDVNCPDWWFPLGRYVKPKHPWTPGPEIGLSFQEANRHSLVVAPTRAGKTASMIAPWIVAGIQAGYTVVAIDVKGQRDLIGEVTRYRDATSPGEQIRLVNWDYQDPAHSRQWNFFAELDDDGAVNAAAEAICGRARPEDPNKNFHLRDLKWARGLLELVYDTNQTFVVQDLLSLLADPTAMRNLVGRLPRSRGAQRLRDLCNFSDDEFAKATQFLATHFETLNTPGFNAITRKSQIDMRALAAGPPAFVVCNAPTKDGSLSEAASGLFIGQLIHRRLSMFGAVKPPPMLLVLDEAPRLQDRLDLGRLLSLSAGAGVSMLIAAQEIEQFDEKGRQEILANCGTIVALPGANTTTTDYLMARLGNRVRGRLSSSDSYDLRNGRSTSYSRDTETVPVMDRAALVSPPSGPFGATVINSHLSAKPILVDLTRHDL